MTEKLYYKNSFLKEFEAEVLSCEDLGGKFQIILNKTAFFPEGGGQTADKGTLNGVEVLDVQINGDLIYHYTQKPFCVGDKVKGELNFERRFDFMQQHSGEHIVSGVAHSLYGCENVGFHLSDDIVTLDFDKFLSREEILKIEEIANQKVWENVKFKTYFPDSETLKTLEYRSKKELEGQIRIVEIENTDKCACCAPHINEAGEIGLIKLLDSEKLRGGVRIELKCGNRALKDYNNKYKNVAKISSMLCVKQEDTAEAVEKSLEQSALLRAKLAELQRSIIEYKTKDFNLQEEYTATFEEGLSIKDLQLYADRLHKKSGGVRGVFSGKEGNYSFAICGESGLLDEFFFNFKKAFTVKGGGRNGIVQGTINAEKDLIEKFFKKYL